MLGGLGGFVVLRRASTVLRRPAAVAGGGSTGVSKRPKRRAPSRKPDLRYFTPRPLALPPLEPAPPARPRVSILARALLLLDDNEYGL